MNDDTGYGVQRPGSASKEETPEPPKKNPAAGIQEYCSRIYADVGEGGYYPDHTPEQIWAENTICGECRHASVCPIPEFGEKSLVLVSKCLEFDPET